MRVYAAPWVAFRLDDTALTTSQDILSTLSSTKGLRIAPHLLFDHKIEKFIDLRSFQMYVAFSDDTTEFYKNCVS